MNTARLLNCFKLFSTAHAAPVTYSLLGRGGQKNDNIFPLLDRAIGIGTDPKTCAIIYSSGTAGISAFHCQLVPQNGGWTITDFSDSGTWLNGAKMNKFQAYPLNVGDVFYLASLENSFCLQSEAVTLPEPPVIPTHPVIQTQPPITPPTIGHFPTQPTGNGIKEKFFTWEGRLNRKPYILRQLCLTGLYLLIQFVVAFILALARAHDDAIVIACSLATLPLCIPAIMLAIRRFHDTDHSGWWMLATLIPLVNFYTAYLLLIKKGTTGANRFGVDPLA